MRCLNVMYVSAFIIRNVGSSVAGMFLSSKEAKSKPSCPEKLSSVMILVVK